MAQRRSPSGASMYDFRDTDIMFHIAEHANGGMSTPDIAEALGFAAEEGGRNVGIRMAWMRKYGMVVYDEDNKLWNLSQGGKRVIKAHERAPSLRVVEKMPDELMVDVMAHVTSRYQRGDEMLGTMLRREFLYGTKRR